MAINAIEWDRGGVDQHVRMICLALPGKKMDQARLKQLLETTGQQGQIELKVLHNAVVSCIKDYQSESTASRLKDWKAAERALEEKIDALWSQHFGHTEQSLDTIADVIDYLEPNWKVTKTSIYRHQKEGKLLPQADGTFLQKDIDKYAKTWLKQKSTGKRVSEKLDELQRKKLEQELQNLELENKRKRFNFEKDQEKYIPKEMMEVELAARAGILDAGLKHWIQSRAADWIRTAAGDTKKVGELINLMNRDLDEHINRYAASTEYQVIIDAEEEEFDNEIDSGEAVE